MVGRDGVKLMMDGRMGIFVDDRMLHVLCRGAVDDSAPISCLARSKMAWDPPNQEEPGRISILRYQKRCCRWDPAAHVPRAMTQVSGLDSMLDLLPCAQLNGAPHGRVGAPQPGVMALVEVGMVACPPPMGDLWARLGPFGP